VGVVLAGVLAGRARAADAGHPFAGNWTISFQVNGSPRTFASTGGGFCGAAAMNQIFTTNPCEEPSDYYTGTFSSGGQSGPLAGCTTGADDRTIFARYSASGGTGYLQATLGASGATFSGRTTSTRSGTGCSRWSDPSRHLRRSLPGDGSGTAPPLGCLHPAGQQRGPVNG
jgi:hypothetical protein